MTFDEYQKAAMRTCPPCDTMDQDLQLGVLGLAGETGEVVELVKKAVYHGHDLDTAKMAKELGDVLWYVAKLADALGYNLAVVAEMNIEKLKVRYPEGFDSAKSISRAPGDV